MLFYYSQQDEGGEEAAPLFPSAVPEATPTEDPEQDETEPGESSQQTSTAIAAEEWGYLIIHNYYYSQYGLVAERL